MLVQPSHQVTRVQTTGATTSAVSIAFFALRIDRRPDLLGRFALHRYVDPVQNGFDFGLGQFAASVLGHTGGLSGGTAISLHRGGDAVLCLHLAIQRGLLCKGCAACECSGHRCAKDVVDFHACFP